jgi:KDO2-lipid IV(A) lauroyltransferase
MNSLFSRNQSILFEELEKLKCSFSFESEEDEKNFYKKNSYLFATTSASLFRLMPQVPYSKHKSIFEKLLFNLQLLNIEEQNPRYFAPHFEIIDTDNIIQKAKNGQPSLFCCFHLGSYSLLPTLFTYNDLDFGFLLNKTLMNRKAESFSAAHHQLCKEIETQEKKISKSKMQLINVEESKGIWKAIQMLKEGKSLIVYADGNTGSNYSKKESQNTVNIEFLCENLRVRQGIAFLSYMCNIPITPVLSSRIYEEGKYSLKRKFEFLPRILPPNFENTTSTKSKISKEEFAVETMQKLYSILEKEVIKNGKDNERVSEWEGWIFVNKFFEELQKPISMANKKDSTLFDTNLIDRKNRLYIFNEERFALIENKTENEENQKKTLFDKFTYRFFPVSDLLYEIITYFSVPKKLYLSVQDNEDADEKITNSSHSPISTNLHSNSIPIHSDSKLQLSKTLISVSALEKLIEKNILAQCK